MSNTSSVGNARFRFSQKFTGAKNHDHKFNVMRRKIFACAKTCKGKFYKHLVRLTMAARDKDAFEVGDDGKYIKINDAHSLDQKDDAGNYINRKLVVFETDDEKKDAQDLMEAVINTLEGSALSCIGEADNIVDVIRKLDKRYFGKTFSGRASALDKLLKMKWDTAKFTAYDHVEKIKDIIADDVGTWISAEELLGLVVIRSFPKSPEWNQLASELMRKPEAPSEEDLAKQMSELHDHIESQLKDRSSAYMTQAEGDDLRNTLQSAMSVMANQKNQIKQLTNQNKQLRQHRNTDQDDDTEEEAHFTQGNRKNNKCNYCGEEGHYANSCRKRIQDERNGVPGAAMGGGGGRSQQPPMKSMKKFGGGKGGDKGGGNSVQKKFNKFGGGGGGNRWRKRGK
jgi:hypothetical protein